MTTYKCIRCGARVMPQDLKLFGRVQCSQCSYRILVKERPPVVKTVKAR